VSNDDRGAPQGGAAASSPALSYSTWARFYDAIIGDRSEELDRLHAYLSQYHPSALSVLELGCGTGAMLSGLAYRYEVTGVDRSPEMLQIAADKLPAHRLVQADITQVRLGQRFDVVLCVFDTLNHLPSFADWQAMFERVHEHLAEGGLFIFDVNTVGRLRRLGISAPYAEDFGEHVFIMTVRDDHDGLSDWQVRVFERQDDGTFLLHSEHIPELGVPLQQIRAALAPKFDVLEESGLDGEPGSDHSERVFYVCRHKPAVSTQTQPG
jgi:SAM-dependent methyltransferase